MSVRKVRSVVRVIRGLEVPKAQALLDNMPKAAAKTISKVLQSAVANATRTGAWTEEQLVISRVLADQGPSVRRFRAAPMGRAAGYRKKQCHLIIELDAKSGANGKKRGA